MVCQPSSTFHCSDSFRSLIIRHRQIVSQHQLTLHSALPMMTLGPSLPRQPAYSSSASLDPQLQVLPACSSPQSVQGDREDDHTLSPAVVPSRCTSRSVSNKHKKHHHHHHHHRRHHFLSSISTAMLTRDTDIEILSACLSIHPSRSSIVSKQLNVSPYFLQHMVAQSF